MRPLFLALAVLVSLVPLWPVYESPAFLVAAGAGALLGALTALLSARQRWSVLRTGVVTLILYLVVGVPIAVPSAALFSVLPSLNGWLTLLSGTVLSWKQLVTVAPPVGSYEALLVPALLLSWIGMLVGLSLALRKPQTSWPALVPLVTLVIAIWLGSSRPFYAGWIALAVFALVALWFASARGAARAARGTRARTSVRAVAIVVGASVLALAVGTYVPIVNRTVWRTSVEQAFIPQADTSPLSEYRRYITGDLAKQTLLTVTGLSAGQRLALATLDNYTGVVYAVGSSSADFTRMPGSIALANRAGDEVAASVTVDALTGPWVPLTGALGSITFTSSNAGQLTNAFYYSRSGDTGALLSGIGQGDAYRVRGLAAPTVAVSSLGNVAPGTVVVPAPAVLPTGLDEFISSNAGGATSAGDRLRNVLQALLAKGYISHGEPGQAPSTSGHGANRLTTLFAANPMVGDAEQYAAAAALIATQLGFPTRVVMGFVAPEGSRAGSPISLTGSQMTAWIEISTSIGWVAVNPVPVVRPIPNKTPDDPTKVAFPQTAVDPPPADASRLNDAKAPQPATEEQPSVIDPFWVAVLSVVTVVGWTALWLLILASPLLLIEWVKRRRRARRKALRGARDRSLAAWDELRDALADYGHAFSPAATRREVVSGAGLTGDSSLQAMAVAKLADQAQYSRDAISAEAASEVWSSVDAVLEHLDSLLTLRQRIRARFSVVSLGISVDSVLGLLQRGYDASVARLRGLRRGAR